MNKEYDIVFDKLQYLISSKHKQALRLVEEADDLMAVAEALGMHVAFPHSDVENLEKLCKGELSKGRNMTEKEITELLNREDTHISSWVKNLIWDILEDHS